MALKSLMIALGLTLVASTVLAQDIDPAAQWRATPQGEKEIKVSEAIKAHGQYVATLKEADSAMSRQISRAYERCFSKHDFAVDVPNIVSKIDVYYKSPENACRYYDYEVLNHIASVCRPYLEALMEEEQEFHLILRSAAYAPCP